MIQLPDDFLACNCAKCDRVLASPKERERMRAAGKESGMRSMPVVAGRVAGRVMDRPYCAFCLKEIKAYYESMGLLIDVEAKGLATKGPVRCCQVKGTEMVEWLLTAAGEAETSR